MKLYEKSILVDIIETKLLDSYPEYYPQGQYNGTFIKYFYRYLRNNTYTGKHEILLKQLYDLKQFSDTLDIKENTDRQTFVLTDDNGISAKTLSSLTDILKNYHNYEYIVKSKNRLVVKVGFGWLPQNAGSWLNLLSSENIIDYYIDGITLRPNTRKTTSGKPDSGYVCYRIEDINEYDTIMFLINNSVSFDDKNVKFTFASLLTELEGTKGATLNRIVTGSPQNAFYEVGPYTENYISSENASLIIQVPYDYAVSDGYYVFDVGNSVKINNNNTPKATDPENWYVPFSQYIVDVDFTSDSDKFIGPKEKVRKNSVKINDNVQDNGLGKLTAITKFNGSVFVGTVNYNTAEFNITDTTTVVKPYNVTYQTVDNSKFIYNSIDIDSIDKIVNSNLEVLDTTVVQYVLGDFIWRTSDSKLIAYLQNLINALYSTANIRVNGVWSDALSEYVIRFKSDYDVSTLYYDDVVDKNTEEVMTTMYKIMYQKDPNMLFTEW